MSMRGQISIILFCLLTNIAMAQSNAKTFKEVTREGLDSIVKTRGFELHEVSILGDTAIRRYIDERILPDPKAILYVQYFQLRGDSREGRMKVSGALISLKPPKSPEHFSFITAASGPQITEVAKVDRTPPEEEKSFWDSVLQPTLVTLGAVTIIALFFLIRS